jgi:hypothetical protein
MSDAQAYYDQVLGMGHTEANALAYTRQHYPDFIPQPTAQAPPPEPVPQPTVELQPAVMQPAAVTSAPVASPQPATSPAVAQPSVALPAAVPAMASPNPAAAVGAPALGATPQPYLPMVEAGPSPAMTYAAVALLLVGALLGVAAQFNHEWIDYDDEAELSNGLTSMQVDCSLASADSSINLSKQAAVDQCKVMAYGLLSPDMANSDANVSADDLDDVQVGDAEDYCNNVHTLAIGFIEFGEALGGERDDAARANASAFREDCLQAPRAGSTGGIVLWLGAVTAIGSAGLLIAGTRTMKLPGGAERFGHLAAMAAGGVMLLAVAVWWFLLPDTETATGAGSGVWAAVGGGLVALSGGVVALLSQR